jgi:hypothetical protein
MPYANEYSKHRSITDIINSEKVKTFMGDMKVITRSKANFEKIDENIFIEDIEALKKEERLKYVFAFDGSKTQIALDTGFPGAEVGIIKISQTFIQLELMKKYEAEAFPHPSEYDEIFMSQNFEITVPGFNVCSEIYGDPKDFFRFSIYNYLANNHNTFIDVLNEKSGLNLKPGTFLETYIDLLKKKPESITCAHPCEYCQMNDRSGNQLLSFDDFFVDNFTTQDIDFVHQIKCGCKHNPKDLFITDLLHFHEGFSSSGSNEGLYTQIMSFFEKVIFMNLLHNLKDFFPSHDNNGEEVENPVFRDCAFILDGPLAIYNYASWFATAMADELISMGEDNLLVVGVEKTGHFMEHLKNLNGIESPEDKPLKPGLLFFLGDNYIKRYVKYSTSPIPYGKNVYFGKKLFYKSYENQLFVINLAYNSFEDREVYLNSRNTKQYLLSQPRLRDIAWLLEKYSSSRYANALSFVSMAHENASISSNYFSKRVIDDFVKNSMSKEAGE